MRESKGSNYVNRQALFKWLVLIVVASMVFVSAGCSPAGAAEAPTSTPLPTPVVPVKPVYQVKLGDIVSTLNFSGRIAPIIEATLFFRTDGRIRKIYVKDNEPVKKDQVLADLEVLNGLERQQALGKYAIQEAEIRLAVAQLSLKQAATTAYAAQEKVYDVAFKKYEVQLAEIALNVTRLNNEDLAANISDAQIISPIDGVLTSSRLSAGSTVSGFTEAMVVANIDDLEVSAEGNSAEVLRVEKGMPAEMTLISRPGVKITGSVRKLPQLVTTDSTENIGQDKSIRITMDTPAKDAGLEIGDLIQVKVIIQKKLGVLWLPPQAIRTFEGRRFAIVQDGSGQRRVDVKIGIQNEDQVEILEGLTEGQTVLSP
jgi:RND family efflux transporter MFP subunit